MKKKLKLSLMALLCPMASLFAQTQIPPGGLQIGDKIPDEVWEMPLKVVNHPEGKGTITLGDYKGKLIILDFWATWCGACVKNFSKLEELENRFKGKLKIIGVTKENKETTQSFLEKYAEIRGKRYHVLSIVKDTVFGSYFPHKAIPHYAWIGSDGIVTAVTSSSQLTTKNVEGILGGEVMSMPVKKDLMDFDYRSPLFVNGNGGEATDIKFRSLLTGHLKGIGISGSVLRAPTHLTGSKPLWTRIFAINHTPLQLYKKAFNAERLPDNRIVLDVKAPSALHFNGIQGDYDKWKMLHTYCYELIVPEMTLESIRNRMQRDLKEFFGLKAAFEKRLMNCWILTATSKIKASYTAGGRAKSKLHSYTGHDENYIVNLPVSALIEFMNRNLSSPVVNETGELPNLDLRFPGTLSDLPAFANVLEDQGLKLTRGERLMKVLVISED